MNLSKEANDALIDLLGGIRRYNRQYDAMTELGLELAHPAGAELEARFRDCEQALIRLLTAVHGDPHVEWPDGVDVGDGDE